MHSLTNTTNSYLYCKSISAFIFTWDFPVNIKDAKLLSFISASAEVDEVKKLIKLLSKI